MIQFLTIYHNGVTTSRPIPNVILKVYGEIPEEEDCEECSNIWYSAERPLAVRPTAFLGKKHQGF